MDQRVAEGARHVLVDHGDDELGVDVRSGTFGVKVVDVDVFQFTRTATVAQGFH